MDVQNRERSKPAEVPSADELERYEKDGYLVVRQVLSDQHLDPIRRVMERTVERQADEWYEQGLIANRCRDEPFERRYGALRAQLPPTFSNGNYIPCYPRLRALALGGVTKGGNRMRQPLDGFRSG